MKTYEEKYKKALEWMREVYPTLQGAAKEDAEYYFPELCESEDEKIRQLLLRFVKYDMSDNYSDDFTPADCVAWLEKQGEHAKFCDSIQVGDKVTRNKDGVLVNLSQLNRVAKKDEKQGEQKHAIEMKSAEESLGIDSETYNKIVDECIYGEQTPVDKVEPKFKVGDKIVSTISNIPYYITEVHNRHYLTDVGCIIMFNAQDNFKLVEQNSAWSEEDEETLKDIITSMTNLKDSATSDALKDIYNSKINWLKSIKDRVQPQPKQEWSEEDENIKESIITGLEMLKDGASDKSLIALYNKKIDWLKSLRPQSTWKPTEQQIKVLNEVINFAADHGTMRWNDYIYNVLKGLREQLKKL